MGWDFSNQEHRQIIAGQYRSRVTLYHKGVFCEPMSAAAAHDRAVAETLEYFGLKELPQFSQAELSTSSMSAAETKAAADKVRQDLLTPFNGTIANVDDYPDDELRSDLIRDGYEGEMLQRMFEIWSRLREPTKPLKPASPVVLAKGADVVPFPQHSAAPAKPRVAAAKPPPEPIPVAPAPQSFPLLYTSSGVGSGQNINREFQDSEATRVWREQNNRT